MISRLKQYMVDKNVSRKELADAIGMTYNGFNRTLAENRSLNSDYLDKLLKLFPDLDARWLITGEGSAEGSIPIYKVVNELLDDHDIRNKMAEIIAKKLHTSQ